MMTDARVMSIDELKAFLASSNVLTFKGSSREETYSWIERTLGTYSYFSRPPRLEKAFWPETSRPFRLTGAKLLLRTVH
jgi:hypothetical protein